MTKSDGKKYIRQRRDGCTLTELIVSSGLLVTVVAFLATSVVGSQRLQRAERQYRVAVDELSNQLERLTVYPLEDARIAIAELQPSDWAAQSLLNATLIGEVLDDEFGRRIRLEIQWERPGHPDPLIAVGWLPSIPTTEQGELL